MHLRVCSDPHDDNQVNKYSTVEHFFQNFYKAEINNDDSRKPVSKATIKRRQAAVGWWTRIMRKQGDDPPLCEIDTSHLKEFRQQLPDTPYKRSPRGADHWLNEVSQMRTIDELQIVLAATGPKETGKFRAGLLNEVPKLYVERVNMLPKPTWSLAEARQIAKAASTCEPTDAWKLGRDAYHLLAKATIAFWFYTGHRATTFQNLTRDMIKETKPELWCLDITKSVKTGKVDRVPIHRQLLKCLNELHAHKRFESNQMLIPWPLQYYAISNHHKYWQKAANLPENRIFSPQAWRRLHGEEVEQTAYRQAQKMSSESLGHASQSTTADHYVLSSARLQLPELFLSQLLLF